MAVDDVTFEIAQGKITSIIGPNGAGKTTVFNLISGLLKPQKGKISFLGKDITHLAPYQIAFEGISRTFQNRIVFSNLSVRENILTAADCHTHMELFGNIIKSSTTVQHEKQKLEKVEKIIEFLNLSSFREEPAGSLPYGSLSSLEIGMALATDPKVLMLDEPVMGMSPTETQEVMKLVKKIQDRGITILLIEHDMSAVMGVSDWIVVLNYGRKIAEGTPTEIKSNQKVIDVYLGRE
jgi:branched-chain amino acid transport system ATP-binding protein